MLHKQQSLNDHRDSLFEPAQTMASTNLEVETREMTNNELGEYQNVPVYLTNKKFFRIPNAPSPYDDNCGNGQCPYNTNLNI